MNQKTKNILFLVVGIIAIVVISNILQNKSSESFRSTLDEKEQEATNTQSEEIVPRVDEEPDANLVVKGFYLDMPIDEAAKKVQALSENYYIDTGYKGERAYYLPKTNELINSTLGEKLADVTEYIPFKKIITKKGGEIWEYGKEVGGSVPPDAVVDEHNKAVGEVVEILLDNKYYSLDIKGGFSIGIDNNKIYSIEIPCEFFNACDLSMEKFGQQLIDSYKIPELNATDYGGYKYESDLGYKVFVSSDKTVKIIKTTAKAETKFD